MAITNINPQLWIRLKLVYSKYVVCLDNNSDFCLDAPQLWSIKTLPTNKETVFRIYISRDKIIQFSLVGFNNAFNTIRLYKRQGCLM